MTIVKPRLGIRFWPGSRSGGLGFGRVRPAITLDLPARQYMVRFGRDEHPMFSERYSGEADRPRTHWYGPLGLTLRILTKERGA